MLSKRGLGRIWRASTLLLTLLVNACVLAPGHYVERGRFERNPSEREIAQGAIPLIPISATAIRAQARRDLTQALEATPGQPRLYEYRVGAYDILSFTVWEHPELTIPAGEFRSAEATGHPVDSDGNVFFPYVGKFKVADLTLTQIRERLTHALRQYITNPQLDVRVVSFRSQKTFVTGEVAKPSTLSIMDAPMTLVDAINLAGGATPEADLRRVRLSRQAEAEQVIDVQAILDEGQAARNLLLQGGDIVHVPDRTSNRVYVLGEVQEPSVRLMHKGRLTLADALGMAKGFDPRSVDANNIYVIRGVERQAANHQSNMDIQPVVYHLDAEKPDALLLSTRFDLEPLDVVYVSTAGVARFYRVLSQLLPTLTGLLAIETATGQ